MVNLQLITVAGMVNSTPRFAKTKDGRNYCSFSLGSVSSVGGMTNDWTNYNVFMFEGRQYDIIKSGKINVGDNIMVTGRFQIKNAHNKASINKNIYINDVVIIASGYANSFSKEEFDGNERTDVEDPHNEAQKPQAQAKNYNPSDFDWGD